MAELRTIARPYAQAIFEFSLENDQLQQWSIFLEALTFVSQQEQVQAMLVDPATTTANKANLFIEVCKPYMPDSGQYSVNLMAENQRLPLVKDIYGLFLQYKDEYEKTLQVDIKAPTKMTKEDEDALIKALELRLKRKVKLNCTVDAAILGGAVIRAGDWVLDGSVQGQLKQLANELAEK